MTDLIGASTGDFKELTDKNKSLLFNHVIKSIILIKLHPDGQIRNEK
ncbi:MAG: hypothetical protein QNL62_10350 [Gammaproteobacteria bacterium]|nr:hypothetical protein [Gammaproteobacteria bacterium]